MPAPQGRNPLLPQLASWYSFNQALAAAKDVSAIFSHTMVFLTNTFDAHNGLLGLLDGKRGKLSIEEAVGPVLAQAKGNSCKADEGVWGDVIRCGSPIVIADAVAELLARGTEETAPRPELSCVCAPLRWGDEPLGILLIDNPLPPSEERLTLVQAVAAFISPALVVARWGDETSLNEILKRKLQRAVERMDLHTESHGDLMSEIISLVEQTLIRAALKKAKYVQLTAARFLGINRNTLRKKIKELGIALP
jgi:transcriptional regulator with GAF, ATPase, and Fis domain